MSSESNRENKTIGNGEYFGEYDGPERSYKWYLGQEKDSVNLSGPGGDSRGKKILKGNCAFYFKILLLSEKQGEKNRLSFLQFP